MPYSKGRERPGEVQRHKENKKGEKFRNLDAESCRYNYQAERKKACPELVVALSGVEGAAEGPNGLRACPERS